jgi:sulfur carrier protein
MKLTINGEPREIDLPDQTLNALLTHLGLTGKPVVVELNLQPVLPGDHTSTSVSEGDQLEIVTIAAGG